MYAMWIFANIPAEYDERKIGYNFHKFFISLKWKCAVEGWWVGKLNSEILINFDVYFDWYWCAVLHDFWWIIFMKSLELYAQESDDGIYIS